MYSGLRVIFPRKQQRTLLIHRSINQRISSWQISGVNQAFPDQRLNTNTL
jgi:hypothetical protein